jgi:hypothetical protein
MATSARFAALIGLLLAVPAALFLLVGVYNGDAVFRWFLPNYLYMAAPHLLVATVAFWPGGRRPALLLVLVLLNVLLVAFQLWVRFAVPPRESGFAWALYIPLWVAALAIAGLVLFVARRRRVKAVAPTSTVGT